VALAADIKVIANSSVTANTISARDLRSVFLGERTRLAAPASYRSSKKAGRFKKPS
jgi:hypothetical protein